MTVEAPDASSAPAGWRTPARRTAKVSHLLAADLRRRILRGDLAEGTVLPTESELVVDFQVSRDTLREALRILESQSLVEVRRGRGGGTVVRRPGLAALARYVGLLLQVRATTLTQLEQGRAVLEGAAVARLATVRDEAAVERLRVLHEQERAAAGDATAFAAACAAFDRAVVELSASPSLAVVAGVLREIHAGQVPPVAGPGARGAARRMVNAHGALVEAVGRGDAGLARDAFEDYLAAVARVRATGSPGRTAIDVVPVWRASVGDAPPRMAAAVALEVRCRIAGGRLAEGDRLPPLPELAGEFDVSRPTLREALRVLETEGLVELRTGDRAGGRIRSPSPQVAAQLAATVLESRGTTAADYFQLVQAVEPAMIELAATGIDVTTLASLRATAARLTALQDDPPRFFRAWTAGRRLAVAAVGNPALDLVADLLHLVSVSAQPAVTAEALDNAVWLARMAGMTEAFTDLVAALGRRDGPGAARAWAAGLAANAPFIEQSELGRRLVVDLLDG